MEIYLTIILALVLVLAAFIIRDIWDYWQIFHKKRKELEEKRTQIIIDEIIRGDAQRKEEEEKIKEGKKQKTKEILKQTATILNSLIIKIWQKKINSKYCPEIVVLGKNKNEKVTITASVSYGREREKFPEKVVLRLENLPGFKPYYPKDFDELSEEERKKIENWLVKNYGATH